MNAGQGRSDQILRKALIQNLALAERTTLKELIDRYLIEVTALSRSAKENTSRLKALSRDPLAALNVTELTAVVVHSSVDNSRIMSLYWYNSLRLLPA